MFAVCLLLALPVAAAEPPTLTLRVTGLFSKDREADLRELFKERPEIQIQSIDFDHAEVALKFDPEKLFPKAKPADVIARLDEKLKNASHHTFGVRAVATVPRDKLTRVKIPVAGLDCKACALATYEALAKLDGVEQATASYKDGLVTALIDPAKTDRTKLEEALKQRNVTLKDAPKPK